MNKIDIRIVLVQSGEGNSNENKDFSNYEDAIKFLEKRRGVVEEVVEVVEEAPVVEEEVEEKESIVEGNVLNAPEITA